MKNHLYCFVAFVLCNPLLGQVLYLGVVPKIDLPEGAPNYREEEKYFWGNVSEEIRKIGLSLDVGRQHGLKVEQIPGSSLIVLKGQGAESQDFLEEVAKGFIAERLSRKERHYKAMIRRVDELLDEKKGETLIYEWLLDYRQSLEVSYKLDRSSMFEILR